MAPRKSCAGSRSRRTPPQGWEGLEEEKGSRENENNSLSHETMTRKGIRVGIVSTYDCEVDERVPGWRLGEVHPAPVEPCVPGADVAQAQQGREGLGAELGAGAQALRVGPDVGRGDAPVVTNVHAAKGEKKIHLRDAPSKNGRRGNGAEGRKVCPIFHAPQPFFPPGPRFQQ